ncbi:MAG: hypothetical protein HY812_05415 [Planctomycetes bacterium]|nr:hypothetical protein [Planctomycetota bacterium]
MRKHDLMSSAARASALLLLLALGACQTEGEGVDLFPLYRNVRTGEAREFSLLFPLSNFEWDEQETLTWTIPFHVHWRRGAHEQITLVPVLPLYFHQRNLRADIEGVFPLFSRSVQGGRTETSLLVLLADWATRSGDDGLAALSVFPLFQWRREGAGARFSLVRGLELSPTGPMVSLLDVDWTGLSYGEGEDERALAIDAGAVLGRIVNLLHYGDAGSHTEVRVLTLLANEEWSLIHWRAPHAGAPGADGARLVLFPFYWDIQHGAAERTRVLWPFYGFRERDGRAVLHYVLFPLLRLVDDEERERSGFDVLWPLIGHETNPIESSFWFHPLFQYTGFDGGYEWSVLLNMFGYGRKDEQKRVRLFWWPWVL